MDKLAIGKALKLELLKGYDIPRISCWAFHVFSNERPLDLKLKDLLQMLFSMESDPQFELNEKELNQLAEKLILEGEKEDLSALDENIKNIAQLLGDNWVMCPICQESWRNILKYRMLRCPGCNNKLQNPCFDLENE